MAQRTEEEAIQQREAIMDAIEILAGEMHANGTKRAWSKGVKDPALLKVSQEVNGPLMELLAKRAKYHDVESINLFRKGAPMVGKLARTGNGVAHDDPPDRSVEELRAERAETNAAVRKGLHEDTKWSAQLLQACHEDHEAGRMTQPRMLHS